MLFDSAALLEKLTTMGPDARIRVNTRTGYASYSIQDLSKALSLYESEGLDLLICEDIYDDGRSVFPPPAHA